MTRHRRVAVAACAAFIVGGCSSATSSSAGPPPVDSSSAIAPAAATSAVSSAAPAGTAPVGEPMLPVTLTDATGETVTVESVERIVPVDGDLAEIVFALGLADHVVATDLSATYPPEVDLVPDIGYQRALDAEPIAAVEPTVVLATDLARPVEVIEQLRDLGIDVVVVQREFTLDGPASKVMAVAEALGVPERGRAIEAKIDAEIESAIALSSTVGERPRVLVLYLRGEQTQLIFGRGTGVDVILPAVGATDVAAELGIADTRQLSAEAVLNAAPDVFIVTTSGLESVGGIEGFLAIPGIAETPAGKAGRVLAYEDQYLLGLGPRFGQMVAEVTADLHPELSPVPALSTP